MKIITYNQKGVGVKVKKVYEYQAGFVLEKLKRDKDVSEIKVV